MGAFAEYWSREYGVIILAFFSRARGACVSVDGVRQPTCKQRYTPQNHLTRHTFSYRIRIYVLSMLFMYLNDEGLPVTTEHNADSAILCFIRTRE